MTKEVPVTYDGIMVGVAELEPSDKNEYGAVVKVRLLNDSLMKPFFVDHTMKSISIRNESEDTDNYDPERLCDDCDLHYDHDGKCGPTYTPGL